MFLCQTHERELGVVKAQLEESIQSKGGDHASKVNAQRAQIAEAKVSALQMQLMQMQAQVDELQAFKKATEVGVRESPAFAAEVGRFFAEMDTLRASVTSEREAREAALAAWEAAEARAHRLGESQADSKSELHRDLKVALEERRVLERNVEWQMEQNRRDESRLRMVEAELRQRTEDATGMRIKLAGFQTEVRAAMEMEQIKAQVMIESLKAEIEYRERMLQTQVDQLQAALDRETLEKLRLEKALKKSELTFQDQLRERESMWRQQQLAVQQQTQRAALELPLPQDVGGVGAKVRSARQREIAEIDERIAGLQSEQQAHETAKQKRVAAGETAGGSGGSWQQHPLTSKIAQLGNDLFKRSVLSMPSGPSPRNEWSMPQPPMQQYMSQPPYQQQPQHQQYPPQQYQNQPPSQRQQPHMQQPQQQHMSAAKPLMKSPANRNGGHGSVLHDDGDWEQEFWNSDPSQQAMMSPGMMSPAQNFAMLSPQHAQSSAKPKASSAAGGIKPPHFVSPIGAGAASVGVPGASGAKPARASSQQAAKAPPPAPGAKGRAASGKPPVAPPPNAGVSKAGRAVSGR